MAVAECPSFSEAVNRLQTFLTAQGHRSDLTWIFREDVIERWPRIFLKVPLQNDVSLVHVLYEHGLERGLGIQLQVFCFLDGMPCCYIWLPQDEEDASYRMLTGLKLTIPAEPNRQQVISVKSSIRWMWLNWRDTRRTKWTWADDLPRRYNTQPGGGKTQR